MIGHVSWGYCEDEKLLRGKCLEESGKQGIDVRAAVASVVGGAPCASCLPCPLPVTFVVKSLIPTIFLKFSSFRFFSKKNLGKV